MQYMAKVWRMLQMRRQEHQHESESRPKAPRPFYLKQMTSSSHPVPERSCSRRRRQQSVQSDMNGCAYQQVPQVAWCSRWRGHPQVLHKAYTTLAQTASQKADTKTLPVHTTLARHLHNTYTTPIQNTALTQHSHRTTKTTPTTLFQQPTKNCNNFQTSLNFFKTFSRLLRAFLQTS